MVREIVKDEEFLTRKSETVSVEEAQEIITDLLDTANAHSIECAGLAAPQIGILKRVVVVRNGDTFHPMMNPAILKHSGKRFINSEGCLSLEGIRSVERSTSVLVTYVNASGKRLTKTFSGMPALIIQHEVDHCDGIVI